ncbi:MAG: 1-acyl-sn-glycerol-3-phosphate acyltransferase [Anaerolineales bacterium]
MSLKRPYRPPLYARFTRSLLKALIRPLFNVLAEVHIQGLENIPKKGAYIVAANHISIYDPPLHLGFLATYPGDDRHRRCLPPARAGTVAATLRHDSG